MHIAPRQLLCPSDASQTDPRRRVQHRATLAIAVALFLGALSTACASSTPRLATPTHDAPLDGLQYDVAEAHLIELQPTPEDEYLEAIGVTARGEVWVLGHGVDREIVNVHLVDLDRRVATVVQETTKGPPEGRWLDAIADPAGGLVVVAMNATADVVLLHITPDGDKAGPPRSVIQDSGTPSRDLLLIRRPDGDLGLAVEASGWVQTHVSSPPELAAWRTTSLSEMPWRSRLLKLEPEFAGWLNTDTRMLADQHGCDDEALPMFPIVEAWRFTRDYANAPSRFFATPGWIDLEGAVRRARHIEGRWETFRVECARDEVRWLLGKRQMPTRWDIDQTWAFALRPAWELERRRPPAEGWRTLELTTAHADMVSLDGDVLAVAQDAAGALRFRRYSAWLTPLSPWRAVELETTPMLVPETRSPVCTATSDAILCLVSIRLPRDGDAQHPAVLVVPASE